MASWCGGREPYVEDGLETHQTFVDYFVDRLFLKSFNQNTSDDSSNREARASRDPVFDQFDQ